MRNRIIIVVLGISLGLGARFAVDFYRQTKDPVKSEPASSMDKTSGPTPVPNGK